MAGEKTTRERLADGELPILDKMIDSIRSKLMLLASTDETLLDLLEEFEEIVVSVLG